MGRKSCAVIWRFGMNSYTVLTATKRWSDDATKRGNKVLNVSSLQFFRSVKCFIASSLWFFTQSYLCKENLCLTLHCYYFLNENHSWTLHHRYFLKPTSVYVSWNSGHFFFFFFLQENPPNKKVSMKTNTRAGHTHTGKTCCAATSREEVIIIFTELNSLVCTVLRCFIL